MTAIKRYNTARLNRDYWDYWLFQEIRDQLDESMIYFSPIYAEIRANAEQAEIDRKMYYEERSLYWRDNLGGERGSAGKAESKAFVDCKDLYLKESQAKKEYYKARALVEQVNQLSNSISGRTKGLLRDAGTLMQD
jgi:hypothetical protein